MKKQSLLSPGDYIKKLAERVYSLGFFDAEAWLGRTDDFPLMQEGDIDIFRVLLIRHSMKGCLISHWLHKNSFDNCYTVKESNEKVVRNIEKLENSYGIITALPLFPKEDWLIDHPKVKAVRIYPDAFSFRLADWCTGSLCDMLVEKKMPLFIFHTEVDFNDLYLTAKKFPQLKIVLESQVRKLIYHARQVLPLMKECPNISLEISNWTGPGFIEYTARSIGSERMVFGSFMPANDPLASMGAVALTELPEADKKKIAGGNILEMIAEVRR